MTQADRLTQSRTPAGALAGDEGLLPVTPWPVRAYHAGIPRVAQAQRLLHALFVGVFLGLMDREALAALDAELYSTLRDQAGDTPLRYADPAHIRSGLADWEAAALERHFPRGARVIITGAGAGREVRAARDLGFEPVGFEPHPGLCAAGNVLFESEHRPDRLTVSPRDAFPRGAPHAQGVVVGWGSFSHIPGGERRARFLRSARQALEPGAPLLVSFWALPSSARYLRTVWLVSALLRRLALGEPTELGDILAPMFVHCFTEADLRAELAAAGFVCMSFTLEPYPHAVAHAV